MPLAGRAQVPALQEPAAGPLPVEVYFSPKGGCTDAVLRELSTAKNTVLVQAYSFTSAPIQPTAQVGDCESPRGTGENGHPLTGEFEEQVLALEREYVSDGQFLSVHHPGTPEGRDNAPDATVLALYAGKGTVRRERGGMGSVLFA